MKGYVRSRIDLSLTRLDGNRLSCPEVERSHTRPQVLDSSPFVAGSWMDTAEEFYTRMKWSSIV